MCIGHCSMEVYLKAHTLTNFSWKVRKNDEIEKICIEYPSMEVKTRPHKGILDGKVLKKYKREKLYIEHYSMWVSIERSYADEPKWEILLNIFLGIFDDDSDNDLALKYPKLIKIILPLANQKLTFITHLKQYCTGIVHHHLWMDN